MDHQARDVDGRIEQAAAVVAQVQDVAFDALLFRGQKRLAHFVGRRLTEVAQAYVAETVFNLRAHRRYVDDVARHANRRDRAPAVLHAQRDDAPAGAANQIHDDIDRETGRGLIVDGEDGI